MIARVKDAVDQEKLSVQIREDLFGEAACVCYGDVPLWRTVAGLNDLDIFLYDPTEYREMGEEEPYSLFCVDSFGDVYTYGMWDTLEDALAWLEEPKQLY